MRLPVSKEQLLFLATLGIEDKDYTREQIDDIIEGLVCECLMSRGWEPGQDFEKTNAVGDMCESIITALTQKR